MTSPKSQKDKQVNEKPVVDKTKEDKDTKDSKDSDDSKTQVLQRTKTCLT
tara:strand:+ start:1696 stop:1845 length:150 start_codon:yes stop_codon:yes gene_type:complete